MINSRLIKSSPEGMRFIYKSVFMMWISLIFNIIATFSISFTIGKLYTKTLQNSDLIITAILIILSIVVRYLSNIKSTEYSYHASTYIKTSLRNKFYQKLLDLGLGYNNQVSTAQITQIGSEGIEQIEIYFSLYLPQFFYSMLAPLTLFVILSWFSVKVSIILLICVPLIPASIIAVNKIAKRLFSKYWNIYTGLGDNFLDNLKGLVTLKIYQDDEFKNKEMNEEAETFRQITMKVLTMQLNSVTLMDLIAYGGAALGIVFALREFYLGNLSMVETIIFVLLSGEFFIPLRLLGSYFHVAMNGVAAIGKIFKIIDLPDKKEKLNNIDSNKIDVELKNINFSYADNKQVLYDITLSVPNNSCIALVGESGCGKSTLASLIMGFENYQQGSILVNGVELNTINESNLMKSFGIVKHKNYLFKGTVRDNLLMGKSLATDEECFLALKMVALDSFIHENGGLDLKLEENGSNLSGGQIQRLSLARAILHDAKLYIFDEASSNIDIESESIIFETIQQLKKTKSIIIISHRLANVVSCDKIYVLEKGRMIEQGTHNELINNHKTYYQLFTQQQSLEKIREIK